MLTLTPQNIWVWLTIKRGGANRRFWYPSFHLPGQPILEPIFFTPHAFPCGKRKQRCAPCGQIAPFVWMVPTQTPRTFFLFDNQRKRAPKHFLVEEAKTISLWKKPSKKQRARRGKFSLVQDDQALSHSLGLGALALEIVQRFAGGVQRIGPVADGCD